MYISDQHRISVNHIYNLKMLKSLLGLKKMLSEGGKIK